MDILAITDVHNRTDRYRNILAAEDSADLLILGGDLTHFGSVGDAEELLSVSEDTADRILSVAGNCDSPAIDDFLSKNDWSVHAEGTAYRDTGFFGVSAMPEWNGTMYEFSEDEIDTYLSAGHSQVNHLEQLVLVSHTPPVNTEVDQTESGTHAGSSAVREWVEKANPLLVICGHIHEARGTDNINGTSIVNPGPARDGYYATIQLNKNGDVSPELKSIS